MNRRLASGDFRDTYQATKDEDSDESVGRPREKNHPKNLSKTQEKFILNLHSCLSMHLGASMLHAMMMNGVIVLSQKH